MPRQEKGLPGRWSMSNLARAEPNSMTLKGSTYFLFKDPGSKNHTVWFLEPESLNGGYLDPLGTKFEQMHARRA